LELIKANFEKKPENFRNRLGIEFYSDDKDSIISVMENGDCYDLIYSSRNRNRYEEMNEIFGELGETI
jgi:hypothetical protein